jgi:hypothetical protein
MDPTFTAYRNPKGETYVLASPTLALYTYPKKMFVRTGEGYTNPWSVHLWKELKGAVRLGDVVLEGGEFQLKIEPALVCSEILGKGRAVSPK